jgi:hypothetical protein
MIKKRLLANSRASGTIMTLPDERYRAVIQTRLFLKRLCDPRLTPRVPKDIRQQALWCLRHYPDDWDMDLAAEQSPDVFMVRMDPVHKFIVDSESPLRREDDKSI